MSGVSVRIDGATVLHPLELTIAAGMLTAIVGPNGAGKTTLLETVARVREPSTGTVWGAGSVAFVPQRTAIPDSLPLTVSEVVAMGTWGSRYRRPARDRARRRIAAAAAALDLDDLLRMPFAALSGGQRQRALLAQALARRADLLLLDEPTTGLDADSVARIHVAMDAELARGATVLAVTHDRALCDRADVVVRLDGGRIVGPAA
jgi:zinc/manganese transport system ATP-binding protein